MKSTILLLNTFLFITSTPFINSPPTPMRWDLNLIDFQNSFGQDKNFLVAEVSTVNQLDKETIVNVGEQPSTKPALPGEKAFQISFSCDVDATLCNKAKNGFQSAANRIASVLRINTPIVVSATFKSFCEGADNCKLQGVLGQAAPSSYFSGKPAEASEDTQWMSYPSALIKQLRHSMDESAFAQFDITAQFNADFDFWFEGDALPMRPKQIDFEFVLCHELTHGLGFDTQWVQWSSVFKNVATSSNYLAPTLNAVGGVVESAKVASWLPMTVFDNFEYETSTLSSLMNRANSIYNFETIPNSLLTDTINAFERSTKEFTQAQYMFQIATQGSAAVTFHNPKKPLNDVKLFTAKTFQVGSSFAHFDYTSYFQTPDFLMIPAVSELSGKTLDDIINTNTKQGELSQKSCYGPLTLGVLEAIGWPTQQNPDSLAITIMTSSESIRGNGFYADPPVLQSSFKKHKVNFKLWSFLTLLIGFFCIN
ncbi:hypothetical protein HDU92_008950 [Lobulomyces angularis]|nr:hypothetical protein HDU92_008950 [Lobulomyces angularis]